MIRVYYITFSPSAVRCYLLFFVLAPMCVYSLEDTYYVGIVLYPLIRLQPARGTVDGGTSTVVILIRAVIVVD